MWVFDLVLKNGYILHTTKNDGDEATKLGKDLESWMDESRNFNGSITITGTNGNVIMFKVSELSGASLKKIDDKDYKLRYADP